MDQEEINYLQFITDGTTSDHVVYLQDTLIPDLKRAGNLATAEDFETLISTVRRLTRIIVEAERRK